MNLQELTKILLHSIGNEEHCIENEEIHIKYLRLVLYLCKLEKGIIGYCSNKKCSCRTNNIILKMLEDNNLVKELENITFTTKGTTKQYIINCINDYLKEVE